MRRVSKTSAPPTMMENPGTVENRCQLKYFYLNVTIADKADPVFLSSAGVALSRTREL